MKVALIQLAYGDEESVADRTARVAGLVRAQAGHDLVVLPELWAAGGEPLLDFRSTGECERRTTRKAKSSKALDAKLIGDFHHIIRPIQ